MRTVCRFLKNLGIKLAHDPTIPLLGIYPEGTIIEKDRCSPVFIVCRHFDGGHSDLCEMIPHCGFDLYFSNNE